MDLLDQFSAKEKGVIELLLQGKSNKQIALALHVTPRTVEYHLTNIYNKLGVNSRSEAILFVTKHFSVFPSQTLAGELRESTVETPPGVSNNAIVRTSTWRKIVGNRKFFYAVIGLLTCSLVIYAILSNLIVYNNKTPGTPNPAKVFIGISPSPMITALGWPYDEQTGLGVLVDFLTYLHEGDYEKAAQIYGGSYDLMLEHNPEIDPNDHVSLLKNACTINGMQCLDVYSAGPTAAGPYESYELQNLIEFKYQVEFANPDGTLFVLGPCCGGNATDSPPQSVFYFTVVKVDQDKFIVVDMPPYVP